MGSILTLFQFELNFYPASETACTFHKQLQINVKQHIKLNLTFLNREIEIVFFFNYVYFIYNEGLHFILSMGVTTIHFGGDVSPPILEKYQSAPPNNRPIIL